MFHIQFQIHDSLHVERLFAVLLEQRSASDPPIRG